MKLRFVVLILITSLFVVCKGSDTSIEQHELEVTNFLKSVNFELAKLYNKEVFAKWLNEIEGPNNLVAMLQSEIANQQIMSFIRKIYKKMEIYRQLPLKDVSLKKQLNLIPEMGYEMLPPEDLELLYAATTNMTDIYKNVKLCSFKDENNCDLAVIPDVQNILHTTENIQEIEYYWLEWRRKTGTAARDNFQKFVELYRKMALLNGYSTPSDYWYKDIHDKSEAVSQHLNKFMTQLSPLFKQFHGYVRGQLRLLYRSHLINYNEAYPQQLAEIFIGNTFRKCEREGSTRDDLPFSADKMPNISYGLYKIGMTESQHNFLNAIQLFESMGMPMFKKTFWAESCEPKSDLVSSRCWHKAWKFYGLNDIKLSYCPYVNEDTFFNMFEAVSDIYYYQAYEGLLTLYQEEPIPNLSEALGKFFTLAASSPRYLQSLKIVDESYSEKQARINRLYVNGLRTIFLLPTLFILERYRLDVIDNNIEVNDNCAYWRLTQNFSGAAPPVFRTNKDFDAPAKLLMEIDDQYATQIYSIILQHQLFEYFCNLTGEFVKGDPSKPLDMCDLSTSTIVGQRIYKAMSLGSTATFKEVLKVLMDSEELSISGLLEYYQPLFEWLIEENKHRNYEIGWIDSSKCEP